MKKKNIKDINKYFLPLGLLSGLYALSFSFIFFFEGARMLALTTGITAFLSLSTVVLATRSNNQTKNIYHLTYLGSFHFGFLFAAVISGGLFSPMLWGQLVISPMAYKFLSKKKMAHIISGIIFLDICLLFLWQSNFRLPYNEFSGSPNPVIQFLAMVPVFMFFPLHTLLANNIKIEDEEEDKHKDQFPLAS